MAQDRNLGVTEARLGLSLITCLLLVFGYVVLQRLGGSGERPPLVIRTQTETVAEPAEALPEPLHSGDQPRVLTPEGWEPTQLPLQTSQRPEWLTVPDEEVEPSPTDLLPAPDAPSADAIRTPLELTDPLRAGLTPDEAAAR